jgi:asparagine synthase (glutamine-hydrolysing)
MSSFAGIYRLSQHSGEDMLDREMTAALQNALSRRHDKLETYGDKRFFLAKLDVGAYPDRAFQIEEDAVATVAGLPLLNPSSSEMPSRARDLSAISKKLDDNALDIFRECQGSYALCHYRPSNGRLTLAVDKVGIRPIYYHLGKELLYFSTSLRVLESIGQIPKRLDVPGVAEMAAFGYPLADRTPYADIKTLRNGEILTMAGGKLQRSIYFRWDEIEPTRLSLDDYLEQVYREFVRAISCRSAYDRSAAAMLSGGLDTRSIVTVLKDLGKDLSTAAFETPGYLDGIYANQYAELMGSKHLCNFRPAVPSWNMWIQCLKELEWPETMRPKYPKLVFSGDGGSVGVGFVLIEEETFQLMRQGRTDLAARRLLEDRALPRRFMRPKTFQDIQEILLHNVRSELERIHSSDRGRDLHIFFLENDQRRHLHPLYENIDDHRLEYLLPFYDGQFLEMMVSGPAEIFLRHKFYHQWLAHFPPEIAATPWQTYPGHEKCPIANGLAARNQWEAKRQDRFSGKSTELYRRCRSAVADPRFPTDILDRKRVLLAMALHRLRMRDYTHVFETCSLFYDYFSKCDENPEPLHNVD